MIVKSDIVNHYEFFYIKKYNNVKYKFIPSPKAEKELDRFLAFLDKRYNLATLGFTFLAMYFSFQFRRVDGMVIQRFSSKDKSGRIQIYDFIGKKAFEYYLKRDKKFDYLLQTSISDLRDDNEEDRIKINKHEEIEKKRFHNSNRGFLNCIEKTSLYNNKSSHCILCSFKNDCKRILELNYNNIFKERGYVATVR